MCLSVIYDVNKNIFGAKLILLFALLPNLYGQHLRWFRWFIWHGKVYRYATLESHNMFSIISLAMLDFCHRWVDSEKPEFLTTVLLNSYASLSSSTLHLLIGKTSINASVSAWLKLFPDLINKNDVLTSVHRDRWTSLPIPILLCYFQFA